MNYIFRFAIKNEKVDKAQIFQVDGGGAKLCFSAWEARITPAGKCNKSEECNFTSAASNWLKLK